MKESWKIIENTDGKYSVSDTGRIKCNGFYANVANGGQRFVKPRVRKLQNHSQGYKSIGLSRGGKTELVHRVVAKAFIPNPLDLEFVNHIDGDKTNNKVSNLEWATRQQNEDHAYSTGLKKKVPASKINEDDVLFILNNYDEMGSIKLAGKFAIHRATVERIVNRVIWTHVEFNKPSGVQRKDAQGVFDTFTGIFYSSVNEAARSRGVNSQSVRKMINGEWRNRTSFILI